MVVKSGAVSTAILLDDSVTTPKVKDGAITNAKLGTDISASKIVAGILAQARGGLGKALTHTLTNGYIIYYDLASDSFKMMALPTGTRLLVWEEWVAEDTALWTRTTISGTPTVSFTASKFQVVTGGALTLQSRYANTVDLADKLTIYFDAEVPTSVSTGYGLTLSLFLCPTSVTTDVSLESNWIRVLLSVDSSALSIAVVKKVGGTETQLASVTAPSSRCDIEILIDNTNIAVCVEGTAVLSPTAHGQTTTTVYPYIRFGTNDTVSRTAKVDHLKILRR